MDAVKKSIRFTKEQAEQLHKITKRENINESALIRNWVMEGIRRYKIDRAVQAYCNELVDIRSGAEFAGIPYLEFVRELEKRRISILTDPTYLNEELLDLAKMFDDKNLERIVTTSVTEE